MSEELKSPFPWYGGKSKIAEHVWKLFSGCSNYVEPFAGSLAMLLARPGGATGVECVNDIDHNIINFWRAFKYDLQKLIIACDFPPSSAECNARKIAMHKADASRIVQDIYYCDMDAAVSFVYTVCALPGRNWLNPPTGAPVILESTGQRGVLGSVGEEDLRAIAARLRHVKIHCGDWLKTLGNGTLDHKGKCAVFLDPPYSGSVEYSKDGNTLDSADVRKWAIENGGKYAIVLCGEASEHQDMPDSWKSYEWSRTLGSEDRHSERYWASPLCNNIRSKKLFEKKETEK